MTRSLRDLPATSHRLKLTLAVLPLACALVLLAASSLEVRRVGAQRNMNSNSIPSDPPPRSEVFGRVVHDDTGRPLRRAPVSLIRSGERGEEQQHAVTDGRGQFRFKGVRKGKYYVAVDVPGILSPLSFPTQAELESSEPDEVRKHFEPVEVDGKADKEVTVRARRGGAISGRITYADGDPAVNAPVYVIRRSGDRVVKLMSGVSRRMVAGLRTDDRGVYRVAGLPAGEYVVGVAEAASHGSVESADDPDVPAYILSMMAGALLNYKLLLTFHPSSKSFKDATVVNLIAGEERDGVDVEISARPPRPLTGVVRARRDKTPVSGAKVSIMRKEESVERFVPYLSTLPQNTVETDEQGRFVLREIPEGQYSLFVNPPEELEYEQRPASSAGRRTNGGESGSHETFAPPRRRRKYASLRRDVQVSGDGEELVIEVGEGARVSGTVAFEGGRPVTESGSVYAMPAARTEELASYSMHSATSSRGEFAMEGLAPGRYFLRSYTHGEQQEGSYVKSITWNGKDLLNEPLEITEGQVITGVQIVYAQDAATLRVRLVSGQDASPAATLSVGLVPTDLSRWSIYSQHIFCMTGEDGSCVMRAPPGDYLVIALTRSVGPTNFESEVRRLALTAPRVSLRAREQETFEMAVPER